MSDKPERIWIERVVDGTGRWSTDPNFILVCNCDEWVNADIHDAAVSERDNVISLLKLALTRLPEQDILRANGTDYLRRIGAFNPLRKE